jgi:glycosyltransferase involved in cell wall biosynthesis
MTCDVSVIIPTYNSSSTLRRALDSVYGQSLLPREIIVVDDGSDDWADSQRIAASYPDTIALRFLRQEQNCGVSAARNVGIAAARCSYLAFLDSDDVWFKEKLSLQYEIVTSRNLDFSMHGYRDDLYTPACQSQENAPLPPLPCSPFTRWTPLLRNDNTSTVMVAREKMVLYDTSLRRGEDFKAYMELLSRQGCRGVYIPRFLAGAFKPSLGVAGLSQDIKAMHLGRMLALKKLFAEDSIPPLQFLFGIAAEMVKYPLRNLRVRLRVRALQPRGSFPWPLTKY